MPTQVQLRRGTTAQHSTFTGAVGEITVDTDKDVVVVHDGSTAGGFPSAKAGAVTDSGLTMATARLIGRTTASTGAVEEISVGTGLTLSGGSLSSTALTLGTEVNSTSGTAIDFTGIPSWAKRITVMFNGVSTTGTSAYLIQLGDSGGIETTGYVGQGSNENGTSSTTLSSGFFAVVVPSNAALTWTGIATLNLISGSTYLCASSIATSSAGTSAAQYCQGSKTLSGTLTQVRITTSNGTDTFDAGSINIMYEG